MAATWHHAVFDPEKGTMTMQLVLKKYHKDWHEGAMKDYVKWLVSRVDANDIASLPACQREAFEKGLSYTSTLKQMRPYLKALGLSFDSTSGTLRFLKDGVEHFRWLTRIDGTKITKYAVVFRKVPVVMVILPAGTALAAEEGTDWMRLKPWSKFGLAR